MLFMVLPAAEGAVEEDRKCDLLDHYKKIWYAVLEILSGDLGCALNQIVRGDDAECDVLKEIQTNYEFEGDEFHEWSVPGKLRYWLQAPVKPDASCDSNSDSNASDGGYPQIRVVWGKTGVAKRVRGLGHELSHGHDGGNDEVQENGGIPTFVEGGWCGKRVEVFKAFPG